MQKKAKNRLLIIVFSLLTIASGISVILYNLQQNIIFFYPPSKLHQADLSREIRIGGLVKAGSISKLPNNQICFILTDNHTEIEVHYQGLIPALFREKQGIIAQGRLEKNIFIANELLTKHDENYMPPEIAFLNHSEK